MASTVAEYAAHRAEVGIPSITTSSGSIWTQTAKRAYTRLPIFPAPPPSATDLRELWKAGALVVDYITEPTASAPANATLYLRERPYSFEELPSSMRRNLRRGLAELELRDISQDDIFELGLTSYSDTRARNGLSDGTAAAFRRHLDSVRLPETRFVGAWHDGKVVAYLRVNRVADYIEMQPYSSNEGLPLRPNDTLIYSALAEYLADDSVRVVSYGLSSVQLDETDDGLHRFKLKVGFHPTPIRREFVPNPRWALLVRPARLGIGLVRKALPGNVLLRKAEGALVVLTGGAASD